MAALTILRRLAEQHDYPALREACLESDCGEPDVQVLLALAEAHLGHTGAAHHRLASFERSMLGIDARIDLAAVHIALDELDEAVTILESARREAACHDSADYGLLLARLAWCRLQHGHREDALSLYEQSLALRPRLAVYHNLLRLYRDSGRLTDMARCLDEAWEFWAHERVRWPDDEGRTHSQQLRVMRLDVWLAREHLEAAEAWVEHQRDTLDEDDWCALVAGLAERLAARDSHVQAEEWLRAGLRRYPEHLMLYRRLAELAQLQGRTHQAIALLRRAIRLANAHNEPTDVLWTRLSAAALQHNPGLAREAAKQGQNEVVRLSERTSGRAGGACDEADSIAERSLHVELAMAAVEVQEQSYSAAERRYRRVLEQRPHMIPALHGLGQLFMQLGRIDDAVALFERVKAIDPTRGYGALINARRFPQDDDTLHRLEQLARTPGMEGSIRTGLLFQLATAWDQREDYEKAFALADEANAVSRRSLHYDPKAHRQYCARIRHAFPSALYEHRPGCGADSTLPVFVVGMPRSGTTLVEQIIAGHSRIHGAGELATIPRVIAGLERWERHTGSGRHYPDCADDLDPAVTRGIAESVLKELRDYAPEADHIVDKLPHNFENIGLIRLLFPRAKIISVRRDPRDVALSNFFLDYAGKHGGMGFAYALEWIGEQLADHHLLMHHWHQVFSEGILEIRYEDVVDDPETSARRMLEHIGVEWEPQVLDFDGLDRPVKTASVWQVRQPLYATSKGKWQRYRRHLKPLIAGTNRKITWDPIHMVTLPEPGWLNTGVDCYRRGDLDAAEYRFKLLLHHLPEHAAARFMLGLIYVRKGYRSDGITLMEQALHQCPWNRHWYRDLTEACRVDGRPMAGKALAERADGRPMAGIALAERADGRPMAGRSGGESAASHSVAEAGKAPDLGLDYLFMSGESTCSTLMPAKSGDHC